MSRKPHHSQSKPRSPRAAPQEAAAEERGAAGEEMRLNRYIARAGVCSRRKADELIAEGRVKVDGVVVTELGGKVRETQKVEVNGRLISPRSHLYFLLNKPEDVITTTDDERGRETVLDLVRVPEEEKQGLFPVGRLDRDTMGVLLLTNDGELAHRLMHPRYEVQKIYRVRTKDPVKPHEIDLLRKGIALEDGVARADEVAYLDPEDHREVGMQIHEGRNRQIRRMMEALGHEVSRLERINYAGLTTEGVRRGRWRRLTSREVEKLYRIVRLHRAGA